MSAQSELKSQAPTSASASPAAFNFDGYSVRSQVDATGLPWFNANDICEVLGYVNPWDAVATHVTDGDDLAKREVIDSLGRTQQANFVNESGLYALIFGSTKAEARRFKKWVTSEVLPSIRKTGSYSVNPLDHIDTTRVVYIGQKHDLTAAGIYYAALESRVLGATATAKKYGVTKEFIDTIRRIKDRELVSLQKTMTNGIGELESDALRLRNTNKIGGKP